MKYSVNSGSMTIEFEDFNSASIFADINGIPTSSIENVTDPIPVENAEDVFNQLMEQGYNIPNTPYYLDLSDEGRAQFSAMLGLVNQALAFGLIDTSTPQTILDKNGNPVTLTTIQFQQTMVGYGFYYVTIWGQKNQG